MVFKLEDEELIKAKEFEKEHWSCGHPTAGERFTYSFCLTGFGIIASIKCNCCKTEEVLTELNP